MITREDFAAWREHPITEAMFDALTVLSDANETAFKERAWDGAGYEELERLRATVRAYRDVAGIFGTDTAYEDAMTLAGLEIEP